MASYHKHIQPTGPPPHTAGPSGAVPGQGAPVSVVAGTAAAQQMIHGHGMLNEPFDKIRHEFDLLAQEIGLLRGQRDDFENKVTSQVNELNIIRQSLYELETQHTKIRAQYDDQIRHLRQEIENLRTQRDGPPPPREGIASLGRSDSVREQERVREREQLLGIVTGGSGASGPGGPNSSIPPPSSATIGPAAPGGGPPRGEASGREALGLGRPGLPGQMLNLPNLPHHPPPPGSSNSLPPAPFSGPGGAPPPPPPMSGPGGPMAVDQLGHGMHPGHPGAPPHLQSLPPHMHPGGPLGLGVGAGDREREGREPRDRDRERDRLERDRDRERSERDRERERYYEYGGGPPVPGRGPPPERTMSGDVVMRDARSSVPGGSDRDRERERDVVMRDSFRDPRAERGLERSESMREMRDREMREMARMERERDRMDRDRLERGDRGERDMRDVAMREMRDRERFLERDPSTSRMERDPRGLEPPVVLGRDRDRDREGIRDGRDVKKVKTEQPPTPGGVGASSPGKDKDGRKGGGDPFSPISTHPQAPPPPSGPGNPNALPPPPGPGGPPPSQPHPPPPFAAGNLPPTPNANGREREGRGSMSGVPPTVGEQTPKLPVVPGPPYPGPPNGAGAGADGEAGPVNANGPEPYPPKETGEDVNAQGSSGPVDLSGIDVRDCPDELKREGSDWFAVFTPAAETTKNDSGAVVPKRNLDVNLVHTLIHESVVCCVRFSADGKFLATGCNRTAQIYDTKTGAKTCVLSDEDSTKTGDLYIRSVCFSPDGKFLATGAEDKQIRIWEIATRKICGVYEGHQQEIYSLDYSKDGRLIVSGSGDRTARIWDTKDGSNNKILTINEGENVDAGVTSVCISPNGRLVAAGSLDTIVRIWDVQTGALVERLKGHRDSVYSVAFTPDGSGLVSGSLDKTLKYWDLRPILGRSGAGPNSSAVTKAGVNGKEAGGGEKGSSCTMNFVGHKDYVLSVAVSHDGRWVVSGSKDRGVQFWDAKSAVVQCMLQGHKNSVISIDLSPAGSILATGSGDWQARIWSYSAQ